MTKIFPLWLVVLERWNVNPREFLRSAREVPKIALQLLKRKAQSDQPFLALDRFDSRQNLRYRGVERIKAWRRIAPGERRADAKQEFLGDIRKVRQGLRKS